jgi:ubiquinone/menaquinone biosynthesis C-methylase UbiE
MSNEENLYRKSAFLYDLDMRDIVKSDIPFYIEYAEKTKGNILELACGTGRVSIELAKNNYSVDCLDLSKEMLAEFEKKINNLDDKLKNNIRLIHGNMSAFNLNKKYNLIIIPFRSFQTLTNEKDILNSLNCIYSHLNEEGIFIKFDERKPRSL